MEIQIKVPYWVETEDEGICMLFAFLRKTALKYQTKALDVYGCDIRRIMDSEDELLHNTLNEVIDNKYCSIAKLNSEHFIFSMSHYRRETKLVTLTKQRSHVTWAYLMGCSNWNLLEADNDSISPSNRPQYTPMYKLEKDVFKFSR